MVEKKQTDKEGSESISMTNTKKEMLQAYQLLRNKLEQQAKTELKPEKEQKAKREKSVIKAAEDSGGSDVNSRIISLKDEIAHFLMDMTAKIEDENKRYADVKEAIEVKNEELREIFDIEKSAYSLAALLEAQKQGKAEFDAEMTERRQTLESKIEETRSQWEKEKQEHILRVKEQQADEQKRRKREQEEFEYTFNREKSLKQQGLKDESEKLNKSLTDRREIFDKETAERENLVRQKETAVAEREKYMDELQQQVDRFPAELGKQVDQAVSETTKRLAAEAKKNEQLMAGKYDGEKNVLKTKIESLEKLVADQQKHIDTLTRQMDTAYNKVQEIAVKAVTSKTREIIQAPPREHREHSESGYKG